MTEFTLKEIPEQETLHAMSVRYAEFDPSAVEAYLILLRVSADILNAATARLNRHGISPARFMVLMLLNMNPEDGQNPSFLSERAGVSRATMTGLITALEQDGYVKREPDANNRREVLIFLTEKGSDFLHQIIPGHFRCIGGLMSDISERERRQFIKILRKIQNQTRWFYTNGNEDTDLENKPALKIHGTT